MYTSGAAAALWRSGPPAERGGEVALKKPSHRALVRVWLATVLSRICPPLFLERSRLIASRRPCDATLPRTQLMKIPSAQILLKSDTLTLKLTLRGFRLAQA
jgi:hypothetical protein